MAWPAGGAAARPRPPPRLRRDPAWGHVLGGLAALGGGAAVTLHALQVRRALPGWQRGAVRLGLNCGGLAVHLAADCLSQRPWLPAPCRSAFFLLARAADGITLGLYVATLLGQGPLWAAGCAAACLALWLLLLTRPAPWQPAPPPAAGWLRGGLRGSLWFAVLRGLLTCHRRRRLGLVLPPTAVAAVAVGTAVALIWELRVGRTQPAAGWQALAFANLAFPGTGRAAAGIPATLLGVVLGIVHLRSPPTTALRYRFQQARRRQDRSLALAAAAPVLRELLWSYSWATAATASLAAGRLGAA